MIKLTKEFLLEKGGIIDGFGSINFNISDREEYFNNIIITEDYIYLRQGFGNKRYEDDIVTLRNRDIDKEFYQEDFEQLYKVLTRKDL